MEPITKPTLKRTNAILCSNEDFTCKKRKIPEYAAFEELISYVGSQYPDINLSDYDAPVDFLKRGEACHFAAQHLDHQLLGLLLSIGADINQLDIHMDNPLMIACKIVKLNPPLFIPVSSFIQQLLENGCNPFQKNNSGSCSLDYIGKYKLLNAQEIIQLLEQLPPDQLPLASGILHHTDEPEVIRFLIGKGISIDTLDKDDYTPLARALEQGNISLVKLLLEHGADTSKVELPFHLIARNLNIELLDLFYTKFSGAVNNVDLHGNNPLMIACNHFDTIKHIKIASSEKMHILQGTMENSQSDTDVEPGAKIIPGLDELNLTKEYVYYGNLFIRRLVNLGGNYLQRNNDGICAAEMFIKHEMFSHVQLLEFFNMIPKKKLQFAVGAMHHILAITLPDPKKRELITLFIENGVSIDSFDSKGNTLLYKAVETLNLDMIIFLVENGANPQLQRPKKYYRPDGFPATAQELLNQKMVMIQNALSSTHSDKYQNQLTKCTLIEALFDDTLSDDSDVTVEL